MTGDDKREHGNGGDDALTHAHLEITATAARKLAEAAIAHARDKGWEITVAVCDRGGSLVAFMRTDDVIIAAVEFAMDKAHTAAVLRKSTAAFGTRMASKPALSLGVGTRPRLMTWTGGVPIMQGDACVGGIGVSGAKDEEDLACARAALASLGFDIPDDIAG